MPAGTHNGEAVTERRASRHGSPLVEVIILAVLIAVLTVILVPIYLRQVDKAREAALRMGVQDVQFAVVDFELDTGSFPPPSLVGQAGLGARLSAWPANPWTGRPMTASQTYSKGDFAYTAWSAAAAALASAVPGRATPSSGLHRFRLIGYTSDRTRPFVIVVPQPAPTTRSAVVPGGG